MTKKGREWEDSSSVCCRLFHVLSVQCVREPSYRARVVSPFSYHYVMDGLSQTQGMTRSPSPHQLLHTNKEKSHPKGQGVLKPNPPPHLLVKRQK